jgi:hypothetical protein
MAYIERQILSTAILSSFSVVVNPANYDQSLITMNFTKFDGTGQVLDTDTVIISVAEARAIVPDMGLAIAAVADKYNPFDPNHLTQI